MAHCYGGQTARRNNPSFVPRVHLSIRHLLAERARTHVMFERETQWGERFRHKQDIETLLKLVMGKRKGTELCSFKWPLIFAPKTMSDVTRVCSVCLESEL